MKILDEFSLKVKEAQEKLKTSNLELATWLTIEAGEAADHVLKESVYGRKVNITELISEIGDVIHLAQSLANQYGFTLFHAIDNNLEKLRKRGLINES